MSQQQRDASAVYRRPLREHLQPWLWGAWVVAWAVGLFAFHRRAPGSIEQVETFLGFGVLLVCGCAFPFMAYSAIQERRRWREGASTEPGATLDSNMERPRNHTALWIIGAVMALFVSALVTVLVHGDARPGS